MYVDEYQCRQNNKSYQMFNNYRQMFQNISTNTAAYFPFCMQINYKWKLNLRRKIKEIYGIY